MKILHFSDIHARDKDIDECSKCLELIVDTARAERPDLIAFSGDAFHSRDVRLESKAARLVFEVFSDLANVAPVVAVIGTPSHDGRAPEVFSLIRGRYPIYMATRPEQALLTPRGFLSGPELTLYEQVQAVITCIPQPTKEYWARNNSGSIASTDEQIAQAMTAIFAGFGAMAAQHKAPHILVGHFTVRGAQVSTGQVMIGREIEVSREQAEMAQAELVCLGHIHKAQEIKPNIFYPGSIYRENWGETEDKGFYLHEITDERDLVSAFVETPTQKLHAVKIDMTAGFYDLSAGLSDVDFSGVSVRVELKAWQDEANAIDRAGLETKLLEHGAANVEIRIIRIPRETVRSTEIMRLTTLREKVQELATTRGEEVSSSLLKKCDDLESTLPDKLLSDISQ